MRIIRYGLQEDIRPRKLPVLVSSKIKKKLSEICSYNQYNKIALRGPIRDPEEGGHQEFTHLYNPMEIAQTSDEIELILSKMTSLNIIVSCGDR